MIKVIQADQYSSNKVLIEKMFRLRSSYRDLKGDDGLIIGYIGLDKFDALHPVYILSINGRGDVLGSVRLIPTTGTHMLGDVYQSLNPNERISSPLIWEGSMFIIDQKRMAGSTVRDRILAKRATFELLTGIIDVGIEAGLDFVIILYDARMCRWFDKIGFKADVIGGPRKISETILYAALLEIDSDMVERLEKLRQPLGNQRYASGGMT